MVERGLKMRTQAIDVWLDVGTIETILETNRYLLGHGHDNTKNIIRENVRIVPPVFIHESATIQNSTIGPNASIDANCDISNSQVEDSILECGAVVDTAILKNSFIGRQARIQGGSSESLSMTMNIGDNSSIFIK
jgi:glucose-1-phosphate thymidylyltransferase